MNNTALFLKEMHVLAQKLSRYEDDAVVDELKGLFVRNSHILNDDETTMSFINELIYCAEKNVTSEDVENLISHLNDFFIYYFSTRPCHIIFVGKNWDSYQRNTFFVPFNKEKITLFEINIDTDPESIRLNLDDDAYLPIVVTDYMGFNFLRKNNIKFPEALISIQFVENDVEKEVDRFRAEIGFIPLLNSRYNKLISEPDINNIIFGSSYAYQGFPDELLEKSVNLSIFGGDLTLAYSLIKNIKEKTNAKNLIICIGLYDVFYELSMGNTTPFPFARLFCKQNNIDYSFRVKLETLNSQSDIKSNKQHILDHLDLFVMHIYNQKFYEKYRNDKELSWLNSLLLDEGVVKNSIDFINDRSYSTGFHHSSVDILERVQLLSKNHTRKHSFENNKEVIASLITLLEETELNLHFIVMPFTQFYIENFDQDLKNETLSYIKSITNDKNVFTLDLSTHEAFTPEDFLDSDHLNFNGAKKLCSLVKQLGLDI